MDSKNRVIIDIDNTISNLTHYICEKFDIDEKKITSYNISDCNKLTLDEKDIFLGCFCSSKIFEEVGFESDCEKINDLIDDGVEVIINSLSYNEDIVNVKRGLIKLHFPRLDNDHILLPIGKEKSMDFVKDGDIIFEDNVDLIKGLNNGINVVRNRVYNSNNNLEYETDNCNWLRVDSISEGVEMIKKILQDREV